MYVTSIISGIQYVSAIINTNIWYIGVVAVEETPPEETKAEGLWWQATKV